MQKKINETIMKEIRLQNYDLVNFNTKFVGNQYFIFEKHRWTRYEIKWHFENIYKTVTVVLSATNLHCHCFDFLLKSYFYLVPRPPPFFLK